jgi:hypothetical protein
MLLGNHSFTYTFLRNEAHIHQSAHEMLSCFPVQIIRNTARCYLNMLSRRKQNLYQFVLQDGRLPIHMVLASYL